MVEGVNLNLNQYTRFMGYPPLSEQIAIHYSPILKHEIQPMTDSIVVPGLKAAFSIYCNTVLTKGATVVTLEPYNPEFINFLKREGFEVKIIPRNEILESKDIDETLSKSELLVLSNAGSDLASPLTPAELQYLANKVKEHDHLRVFSDESLHSFCEIDSYTSFSSLPGMSSRVATVFSGDAEFGAEGINIAWIIAKKEEIYLIGGYQIWTYFSANSVAMVRNIYLMLVVCFK